MNKSSNIILGLIMVLLLSLFISCDRVTTYPPEGLKWYISCLDKDENGNPPIPCYGKDMEIVGNKLIAIRGGSIVCLNKNTGDILWNYSTGINFKRTPIIANNKIFSMNSSGILKLTVLNLDGTIPNDYISITNDNFETEPFYIPVLKDDKIYIGIRRLEPRARIIATIDINTYEVEEFLERRSLLEGRLVINDNLLYVPISRDYGDHPTLLAYDLITKELIWETRFDEGYDIKDYNPILYKGKLYAGRAYKTWVLDPLTGEIIKTYWGPGSKGYSVGEDILFQTADMRAIDLNTDEVLYNKSTPYSVSGGSVYHNGVFYMMSYGLHAYDARTGEELAGHSYDDSPNVWEEDNASESRPLADGDTIYVNGLRGIYAFKAVR